MSVKLQVGKAVLDVAKKGYKIKKDRDWAKRKEEIMKGISKKYKKKETMPYKKEESFDEADKASHKAQEPKRSDYPKGKVGDIKFKVAYRNWLTEKI